MSWLFKNEILSKDKIQEDWIGFIYLITLVNPNTGEKVYYIGKKNFYTLSKRPLAKKEISSDKRRKNYKRVKTFNYEKYDSSSDRVKELKEDGWILQKRILRICKSKGALTYYEVMYLMKYDVLQRSEFINDNILGKFYRTHLIQDEDEEI